jgi:ERCC4-related helicase
MIAIEFTAQITDNTIEIPDAHRGQINGTVRVIILTPENPAPNDMIEQLLSHPIQIEDFSALTRDEAHDRS